jgi:hypothetical protein
MFDRGDSVGVRVGGAVGDNTLKSAIGPGLHPGGSQATGVAVSAWGVNLVTGRVRVKPLGRCRPTVFRVPLGP